MVPTAKNPAANAGDVGRDRFDLGVGKIPWRRKWQPTRFLAWEIPRSERPGGVLHSPWGLKESDATTLACTRQKLGNSTAEKTQ